MNNEDRKQLRENIVRVQHKIVGAAERIIDTIVPEPQPQNHPPIKEVRRYTAELMGAWRFCDRSACHRARHCRGEPMHCLRAALPMLPPGFLAGLVAKRRRQRRARSGAQNRASLRP